MASKHQIYAWLLNNMEKIDSFYISKWGLYYGGK